MAIFLIHSCTVPKLSGLSLGTQGLHWLPWCSKTDSTQTRILKVLEEQKAFTWRSQNLLYKKHSIGLGQDLKC